VIGKTIQKFAWKLLIGRGRDPAPFDILY